MIVAGYDSDKQLPALSTLTIDGTTERITLDCAGDLQPGDPWCYTASNPRWSWPRFDCGPGVLVVLIPASSFTSSLHQAVNIPPVTVTVTFDELVHT